MISIRPASDYDFDALTAMLNAGYQGYPVPIHFDPDQYALFVRSHDVDLALSVVAEVAGRPVGLAQLARRGDRGWVAGVGVHSEHRRQGIARGLMEALQANAVAAGIQHLQLEVLWQNQAALQLYQSLGWEISRELLVWSRPADQGPLPVPDELIVEVDAGDMLATRFIWHDQPPCWQRQQRTLERFLEVGLQGWAIVREKRVVAYALGFPPREGQMTLVDVAVDPAVGIRSAGRPLIQALHLRFGDVTTRLSNEPVDSMLNPLFVAMAYGVVHRQYEMRLSAKAA